MQCRLRFEKRELGIHREYLDAIAIKKRINLRLHFNWHLNRQLEMRMRYELNRIAIAEVSVGESMYVQLHYSSPDNHWKFRARITQGIIDSYNSRIYSYENSPQGVYPIHNLYYSGQRIYVMTTRSSNNLTTDLKLGLDHHQQEQKQLSQIMRIGTGPEERKGSNKYTFVLQLRYRIQ